MVNRSLGDKEIKKLLGNETNILRYEELANYESIEQVLGKWANAVILYPTGREIGHWVGVLYTWDDKGKGIIIEFFDPYGISPDREGRVTGYRTPHLLSKLLQKANFPVHYNQYKFQEIDDDVATCGRHVVNRIRNQHLPLKDYTRLFKLKKPLESDILVTALTGGKFGRY
jgi:hypothetical protein